jgi:hypothetical protein
MWQGLKAFVAGSMILPSALLPAHANSRPRLQDRLPAAESADFALAGMRAMLEPAYRKRPLGLDFGGTERRNAHFYFWMIIPTWGQGLDYFAVDRRTGDVWAYFGCKRLQSRDLAALQAKFRRRFDVSASEVRQVEREGFPGPPC